MEDTHATGTLRLSCAGTFVLLRVLPDLPGMPMSLISRLILLYGLPNNPTILERLPVSLSELFSGDCFLFKGDRLVGDLF